MSSENKEECFGLLVKKPWGHYKVLVDDAQHKVKEITVLPGHRLSLQRHQKRQEHWFVYQGQAQVTLEGCERLLGIGQHIDIPCKSIHRIKNVGPDPLVFVEIQTGAYFGEDDIERIEDDYARK